MRFGCQLYMLIRISLLCLSFPSQSFLYIWASAVALSAAQLKSGRLLHMFRAFYLGIAKLTGS